MIRKTIFEGIRERLATFTSIRHIDLWNRNVEYIDLESPWERPALFVEFCPIRWERVTGSGDTLIGNGTVRLHLVCDVHSVADMCTVFLLSEAVERRLLRFGSKEFRGWAMAATYTNHDHEDLIEHIDEYTFRATKNLREADGTDSITL